MGLKIVLRTLTKIYADSRKNSEVVALQDVSFSVGEEEICSMIGPSGCGKTTCLECIAGLQRPTCGEILIDNELVTEPKPGIGMVFQEPHLYPWRTVEKNIELGPEFRGVSKQERRKISRRLIDIVDLERFEDKYPHELSGGMKQKVAIARALANEPDILLMDEPFGALDAQTRRLMQTELLNIWEKTRKTIVFVTHSIPEALILADKVVVLSRRPGMVKQVVEVSLPRPRPEDIDLTEKFFDLQKMLTRLLDH